MLWLSHPTSAARPLPDTTQPQHIKKPYSTRLLCLSRPLLLLVLPQRSCRAAVLSCWRHVLRRMTEAVRAERHRCCCGCLHEAGRPMPCTTHPQHTVQSQSDQLLFSTPFLLHVLPQRSCRAAALSCWRRVPPRMTAAVRPERLQRCCGC